MLYQAYQFQEDMMAAQRAMARYALGWLQPDGNGSPNGGVSAAPPAWMSGWAPPDLLTRHWAAGLEMLSRFQLTHERPDFGIASARVGGEEMAVREQVALPLPFGDLLHFKKEGAPEQPRVLLVAPLSGHFATLLRGTAAKMLEDHDVYITDWRNARDVPVAEGRFGVEEYVDYLIRFLEHIGPRAHVVAVCQPCVQTLAAVAAMSESDHPATPLSMTLMAGPIDVRESPTMVNDLANEKTIEWFKQNLIARAPSRFAGAGREVYPGFVQLCAFMNMNMERHQKAHAKLYRHLANGETEEADRIKEFYDEYFAILDLTAEFYLETIDQIFQKAALATGGFQYRGQAANPASIRKTALLTVEGGRDDICALGQTAAAHDLCASLRPHLKRHHLQANVGHYGVFNGKRWRQEIYPAVRNMILSVE